jgi:multidrug efflux system outer membrane protein
VTWRLALLAIATLLAGCVNLAPRYVRPPPQVPATVANSFGGEAADNPSLQPWRAFFGDRRLAQVIAEALAHNQDLPAAVANVEIARAGWLTQRSQLIPNLNAQLGASGSHTPATVIGVPGISGSFTQHTYTVEAAIPAYEFDLFGRLRNLSKAAREQYFASQAARDAAQISLVGQVAQAWVTVGSDRSLLAIAGDTLNEASASLQLTQAKFDHGEAAQSDVDQEQSLVQQARYDLARYATQVALDKDALDLLAGTPIGDDLLPTSVADEAQIMGQLPTGVASSVLLARPDVVEAEDQLKGANADIGAARAAFFPTISLTGSGGLASAALSSLINPASGIWSYAGTITQPIFDAGKNRAGLIQAKGQRDLARANYEKAIQTAFREVADALAQRGQIDVELSAQQALVAVDADAVRLIQAQYRVGTASELNVLTAQASLYAAEETLTAAQLLKATNLVALYQALGGGVS